MSKLQSFTMNFKDSPTKLKTVMKTRKDTMDKYVCKEVMEEPTYDIELLHKVGFPIELALDIGGHIGSFTNKVKAYYPDAHIGVFEPWNENFELLEKNVKKLDNVTTYPSAVRGSRMIAGWDGELNRHNTGGNALTFVDNPENADLEINSLSIMEICEQFDYIDLIKLDCENGEWDIIPHIPFEKVGALMIEFHVMENENRKNRYIELKQMIANAGYYMYYEDYGMLPKLFCYREENCKRLQETDESE